MPFTKHDVYRQAIVTFRGELNYHLCCAPPRPLRAACHIPALYYSTTCTDVLLMLCPYCRRRMQSLETCSHAAELRVSDLRVVWFSPIIMNECHRVRSS
eukprot:9487471-Pyramimonas_sp.AAC.1